MPDVHNEERGTVELMNCRYYAHVQYREDKKKHHIRGPGRIAFSDAERDLEALRKSARRGPPSRRSKLEKMKITAQHLKQDAALEQDVVHSVLLNYT